MNLRITLVEWSRLSRNSFKLKQNALNSFSAVLGKGKKRKMKKNQYFSHLRGEN